MGSAKMRTPICCEEIFCGADSCSDSPPLSERWEQLRHRTTEGTAATSRKMTLVTQETVACNTTAAEEGRILRSTSP